MNLFNLFFYVLGLLTLMMMPAVGVVLLFIYLYEKHNGR